MDPMKQDHDIERFMEKAPDHSLQLKFSGETGTYEDHSVYPRIGDEYQVLVPPLEKEMDVLHSQQRSVITARVPEFDYSDRVGLPIPVFWIPDSDDGNREESEKILYHEEDNDKVVLESLDEGRKAQTYSNNRHKFHAMESFSCEIPKCSVSSVEKTADIWNQTSDGNLCKILTRVDSAPSGSHIDTKTQNVQQNNGKHYSAAPGSQSITWTDAEAKNFLLGLHIFGKNLVQVRNFMESKKMGDVLAFYYGVFYKSSAHCRWSECRKSKNKRCIYGQRIFTGWRQHELLSRLLPGISPDKQNTLLQATKTFNEGETSFEDYVAALKETVGVQALVEAVGIGKGKEDLTGIALDHVKGNQALSVHSEVPAGKACSALSSGEIIKFLTGNFRLSKTRSNDLFWEAVWPRLLAKGWHSEQPNDQIGVATKNNLVFLIPGIRKFSRSKLVKGEHYFDSVSDVLNKVALDPMLLVLEMEGDKVNCEIKDNGCAEVVLDQNGPIHENQCYLHSRFPDFTSSLMKFTVVDTSLVPGEEPFKIREIRSLPPDTTLNCIPSSSSDGTDINSAAEHQDSDDASLPEQEESDLGTSDNKILEKDLKHTIDQKTQSDHPPIPKKRRIHQKDANGQSTGTLSERRTAKKVKNQFSHKEKSGKPNYLSPVSKDSKHRKLTACDFSKPGYCAPSFFRGHQVNYQLKSPGAIDPMLVKLVTDTKSRKDSNPGNVTEPSCHDSSFPRGRRLKKEKSPQLRSLNAVDAIDVKLGTAHVGKGSSQGQVFTRFPGEVVPPSKGSPSERGLCISGDSSVGPVSLDTMASSVEKSQQRVLIDLNVPHSPPEFEAAIPFISETVESQDTVHTVGTFQSETLQNQDDSRPLETANMATAYQHLGTNERRQSTRSRPPTTKALEALASGYLNIRQKGRSSKTHSRSSRSARKKAESSTAFTSIGDNNATSETTDSRTLQVDRESGYYENGRDYFSSSSAEPENKHLSCDLLHIS